MGRGVRARAWAWDPVWGWGQGSIRLGGSARARIASCHNNLLLSSRLIDGAELAPCDAPGAPSLPQPGRTPALLWPSWDPLQSRHPAPMGPGPALGPRLWGPALCFLVACPPVPLFPFCLYVCLPGSLTPFICSSFSLTLSHSLLPHFCSSSVSLSPCSCVSVPHLSVPLLHPSVFLSTLLSVPLTPRLALPPSSLPLGLWLSVPLTPCLSLCFSASF